MPRPRRPWIKIYTNILNSSLNYESTLAEQAIFIKLICLAAEYSDDGSIVDGEGQSIPHEFLAHRINASLDVFEIALKKCKATSRISENSTGMHIVKWKQYQSEYLRQKPYRQGGQGQRDKSFKECPKCHYLIEVSMLTERMEICPQCNKKGKEVKLVMKKGGNDAR